MIHQTCHNEAPAASPLDLRLQTALAEELVVLARDLGTLADDLGSNPATLRAHMHSLQSIDRLMQAQIAIADVLRSDQPIRVRLDAIPLEGLARALAGRLRTVPIDIDDGTMIA